MAHSTTYGIDPYHPEIDNLQRLAVRDEKGNFSGWQLRDRASPGGMPVSLDASRLPLRVPGGGGGFTFITPEVPVSCEALFAIGGLKAHGARIRLTAGRRTVSTPPDWFRNHEEFAFPFPLALQPGKNEIRVEATNGPVDWSGAWYEIRSAFGPRGPFSTWTFPILRADITNPEYQQIFRSNLASVVREFGIDAMHIDAGSFYWSASLGPVRAPELFYKLKDALPGTVLGCEFFRTYEEMGFYHIVQNARQSLVDYANNTKCLCEQGSLRPRTGADQVYAWMDKPSPVCSFMKKFVLTYPHLCAANAFVPTGKVCNIMPERLMPPSKEEHWRVLREARKFDYVPALRVNYRKYGLDADTRAAIKELKD